MNAEQQAAYWRTQARKHEQRVKSMGDYEDLKTKAEEYAKLVESQQSEQEKAVAEARRQGRTEALTEAGAQLVEQWVRAAANGRLAEESVNALLEGLDRTRFLTKQGGVDTAKVTAFVNQLALAVPAPAPAGEPAAGTPAGQQQPPAQVTAAVTPTRGPDFGQGQPSTSRPAGLAAGREIARQRFGLATTATPSGQQ